MAGLADREAAKGVSETYQYLVGRLGLPLHGRRRLDPSFMTAGPRIPPSPWTTDEETWADIASGKITASSAAATGALTVAGDPEAAKRLRTDLRRKHDARAGGGDHRP